MHTSDTVYSDFFVCQKICDNGKNVYFFYLGQSFLQFIKKILMANNTGCNFKSSQKLPNKGYLIQYMYQQDTILHEADLNQTRVSSLGTLKVCLGWIFRINLKIISKSYSFLLKATSLCIFRTNDLELAQLTQGSWQHILRSLAVLSVE